VVKALEGLTGVKRAKASHPEKKAVVFYNASLVAFEQMQKVLFKAGYVASIGTDENHKADFLKSHSEGKNEFQSNDLVCFCFEFTRNDIEQDCIKNGRSTIMAKIASEKKAGECDCAAKNPKGR
jgi:hypothetical protein